MPAAARDKSESPFRYDRSRSPSPIRDDVTFIQKKKFDQGGPAKKVKLSSVDIQRIRVEKLLKNPDREVAMPEASTYKPLQPPPEMVKNINGSASGAGSGEFHVYKHARKREHERLKQMEEKAHDLEEQQAFQARQAEREAAAEAKTAKNRAKRQKRKGKSGPGAAGGAGGTGGGGAEGEPKRKLAGGGTGVVFGNNSGQGSGAGTNGEAGKDDDDSDQEEAGPSVAPVSGQGMVQGQEGKQAAQQEVTQAQAAKAAEIVIHDDD